MFCQIAYIAYITYIIIILSATKNYSRYINRQVIVKS